MFKLNHLIKRSTCFKSWNPSFIYNLYTNKKAMFFNLSTIKAGISGHHSFISTMFRSTFCIGPAKFIYHRFYNSYNKEQFKNVLKQRLVNSSNFEIFFTHFWLLWMSTFHWYNLHWYNLDITIKHLLVKRFLKLSWNELIYEIHSTRKHLLKTGKITSNRKISVWIYWSQLKGIFLEI